MRRPRYTHLVLAIPHSHPIPLGVNWLDDRKAAAYALRWTDWWTNFLFDVGTPDTVPVVGNVSRLDCDLERLEHEDDRIGNYHNHSDCTCPEELRGLEANLSLSCWFSYRADLLIAAARSTRPLIIDCHSFPSDLAPDVDVCIGFNEDATRPPDEVLNLIADTFRAHGYAVALNRPYGNAIAPHGYIGESVMLEVSKRVYLDADECEQGDGYVPFQDALRDLYGKLLGGDEILTHA